MILRANVTLKKVGSPASRAPRWGYAASAEATRLFYETAFGQFVKSTNLLCDVERESITGCFEVPNSNDYVTYYSVEVTIVDDGENAALLRLFHDGRDIRFFEL